MLKVACIFKECYMSASKQDSASSGAEPDYQPSAHPGCSEMKKPSQDFRFIGKKKTDFNGSPLPSDLFLLLTLFSSPSLP